MTDGRHPIVVDVGVEILDAARAGMLQKSSGVLTIRAVPRGSM